MLDSLSAVLTTITTNATGLSEATEDPEIFSRQINTSAEASSSQATVVAAAAEQVSANVQTVAAAMEEMSASIHEIAKNTSDAAGVAATAVSVVETASGTVAKLGESSAEIDTVTKVITASAEQTRLLALNANIEAARAGDAGKGFAVVASEVKDLARETADATEDIAHRVAAIQADTEAAVAAIAHIAEIIEQINDTQATIASAVEEQTATANEMSRNVAETATASGEIAANITAVAMAAAATTEGVVQCLTASVGLERMSAELLNAVSGYTYAPHADGQAAEAQTAAERAAGSSIEAAINKALRANWGWQKRLSTAIANGAHGEDAATVARDDRCDFGKWLYGLHPDQRDLAHFPTAKDQHAGFHLEAARTLGLVSAGQQAEARASIANGRPFAEASRILTNTMIEWKKGSRSDTRRPVA